jgi:hypothetical protein
MTVIPWMMSFALGVLQATTSTELAPLWETVKGIMLTLTTGGVLWIARTVFVVRDQVRELIIEIRGIDGKNGVKSSVADHEERIGVIEDRNNALDAVAEAERAGYHGEERRHQAVRQLLEIIRAEIRTEERK